jgi:hypothetical protein
MAIAFRPDLGPTHLLVQGVPEALSLRVRWPERKADHSPVETNNVLLFSV